MIGTLKNLSARDLHILRIAFLLASLPMGVVVFTVMFPKSAQHNHNSMFAEVEFVNDLKSQYELTKNKEDFLTSAYAKVKDIDETILPVELRNFVIIVKVSQFGKQ